MGTQTAAVVCCAIHSSFTMVNTTRSSPQWSVIFPTHHLSRFSPAGTSGNMPPSSKSGFQASRYVSWCRQFSRVIRRLVHVCAGVRGLKIDSSQDALHGLAGWIRWMELEKLCSYSVALAVLKSFPRDLLVLEEIPPTVIRLQRTLRWVA